MNNISDKFIATFILSAVADTMAFNNGTWLIQYKSDLITYEINNELLYDFVDKGGINSINLDGWHISVNTLLHIATTFGLLENNLEKAYLGFNEFLTIDYNNGVPRGINTQIKIKFGNLDRGIKDYNEPYDLKSIDCIAATRTLCIGLLYHGKENREKLIKYAIDDSRLTNNSPVGYLGGLTTALFCAFAIENIDIKKWPYLLINIIKSKQVKDYIREEYRRQEEADYDLFLMNWQKYLELKFNEGVPLKLKTNKNIIYRTKFYKDYFTSARTTNIIGASGYSSVIIAYDCLLDAGSTWEKLFIYSGLHIGFSTVTAFIAGGLYGAYYGWGDVPANNFKYLEHKNILYDLAKNLYKKFTGANYSMTEKKPF